MFDKSKLELYFINEDEYLLFYEHLLMSNELDKIFCGDNLEDFGSFRDQFIDNYSFVCKYDNKLVGIIWLNTFENRTARIHFFTFRTARHILLSGGIEVLERLLTWQDKDNKYLFDVFYGYVPSDNKLAIKYFTKLGFKHFGVIPELGYNFIEDKHCDMICSYITRDML